MDHSSRRTFNHNQYVRMLTLAITDCGWYVWLSHAQRSVGVRKALRVHSGALAWRNQSGHDAQLRPI